ncbi:MAG TPA: hypothetical protein VLG41_16180 [Hydrogenophaga sp.]|uniref:hypothetical protein n=1 Tax=Hydrogenophaga sp. TaxID=1904254 RepID=UPI002B70FC18|nr:hypothetical protein [Hydrogenophaga sp.]HSX94468.1 hypothetical protein [Hydrogenophaga sp.]
MGNTSELFAIAAHLHVLLRRRTGRVTDTEWLATNAEYARAIVRFAREKAAADGHADLLPWADKLEAAIVNMSATPRKTLLDVAAEALRTAAAPAPGAPPAADDHKYVGGLR